MGRPRYVYVLELDDYRDKWYDMLDTAKWSFVREVRRRLESLSEFTWRDNWKALRYDVTLHNTTDITEDIKGTITLHEEREKNLKKAIEETL